MIFHKRSNNVQSLDNLRDILSRFLDDDMRYDLEWDDFISWKNENKAIENVRLIVEKTESLFFSKDPVDRVRGIEIVQQEIDKIDQFLGRDARD